MKRFSNISIGKGAASIRNAKHNDRSIEPSYLLLHNSKFHWVDANSQTVDKKVKSLLSITNKSRKKLGKKKVSTQTHTLKEFIVNLDTHNNIQTMMNIKKYLEETYNFKVMQLAIHADEGVLVEKANTLAKNWNINDYSYDSDDRKWRDKNGDFTIDIIVYQPNKNIFFSKQNNKWYHDRELTKELDMSKVKHKVNLHGHVLVFNLDHIGNSISRTLRPYLKKMQSDIARITNLPQKTNPKRKGENHQTYKFNAALSAKEDEIQRYNLELYNQNQKYIEAFAKLNPKISEPDIDIDKTINSIIVSYGNWRKLGIKLIQLNKFKFEDGMKINYKKALEKITKKVKSKDKFIYEVYEIFDISPDTSLETTIKKLKEKTEKSMGIQSTLF